MSDVAAEKASLRKVALSRRERAHAASGEQCTALLSQFLAEYRGIPLAGYMPVRTEINPLPTLTVAATYGVVGLPVVQGKQGTLKFSRWQPDQPLRKGEFGIAVPAVDDFFVPKLLIVPLLAFDSRGVRLGYGGGYYDRTLANLSKNETVLTIGFAYSTQKVEELPFEATDYRLDIVVTEREVFDFASK
ncbi:MAG: 5-formyltetrahydrofolate cyclo-ligase [Aestuariivita sp.]|nr:5-formyltetrahydrofolate cyclo-ligase [Aestuariivita sp.]MCY4347151.1 5-formyltetrahydrofolate cyclo-ligase [Aestuariivita sp.]